MQRRRILMAAAAASAASLALAGCAAAQSDGTTELTLYGPIHYKDAYEQIIADFEKENPDISVKATFPAGNDFNTLQMTQLAGGQGADLLAVQPGTSGAALTVGALVAEGYLEPLDGDWTADIPDSLASAVTVDDQAYMWPGIMQPLGGIYNTGALEEAGLEAPTTYPEVLAFCKDAVAAGSVPYSLGIADNWITQLVPFAQVATIVYGDDPDWDTQLAEGKTTFQDSEWVTAMDNYMEMNEAGCFSESPNGIAFDQTLPPVASGEALGIVQVGGIFGGLQELDEDVTYEYLPFPGNDDPASTYFSGSPGVGLGVNAASDHIEEAKKFVDYLATPAVTNTFVEIVGGSIPSIPNEEFEPDPLLETFNQFSTEGRVNPFAGTNWPNSEIQNELLVGVQNMFLGRATPAEVLQNMQNAVE